MVMVVVAVLVPVLGPPATASADPAVPPFGSAIDDYAPEQNERTCSPWEKPGVAAFKSFVLRHYPNTEDWQYFDDCDPNDDSGHQQGTAWDWGVTHDATEQANAQAFINWLTATRDGEPNALARRFGILYMIWQGRMWRSYAKNGAAAGEWSPYTEEDQHTDHVHFSFGQSGAYKKTSWWTGQQHVTVSTLASDVHHAMRRTGGWTNWGNVENQSGPLPESPDAKAISLGPVDVAGELHMLAATGGELYHGIRRANGSWTRWGNVEGQANEVGTVIDVAGAEMHGMEQGDSRHDLYVVASTSEGGLYYAIRGVLDGWFNFEDIEEGCGQLPGTAVEVAAAVYEDKLHVLAVTNTSPERNVYHCLWTGTVWTNWGNVENPAGDRGSIGDVAAAMVNNKLHVVISNTDGQVFHTIQSSNGSWTPFGNVEGQSGEAGVVSDVGVTGRENGELHVLATSVSGELLHAVRRTNGWTRWGDAEGQSGPLPANPYEVSMS